MKPFEMFMWVFMLVLVSFMGSCSGFNSGRQDMMNEAVKAGFGEYYLDQHNALKFRWRSDEK